MGIKEMEWECGDWTKLAQDRGKCPAVVSRVTKQLPGAQNDAAPCSAVTAHYVTQQFSPCAVSTVTDGLRFESR